MIEAFKKLLKPKQEGDFSNTVLVEGWEASGSTMIYQVVKFLGLDVRKIHGHDSNALYAIQIFTHNVNPREVIYSSARRSEEQDWNAGNIELAVNKTIMRFVEEGFGEAFEKAQSDKNTLMIRYETFYLGNERILIELICSQLGIPIDQKQVEKVMQETSIEKNLERSQGQTP